jgi:VWFA-related protein
MAAALVAAPQNPAPTDQRPVYGSGVDLVVVSATVTDAAGHFVRGLRQDEFDVLEDGRSQPISAFTSERVPVSLGIALDLSNSMKGQKLKQAREALDHLLADLLDPADEIFLYCFSDEPVLLRGWTSRRDLLRRALDSMAAGGLTALYDTVAQAVTFAQTGKHRKKALIIISDGNDTASHTSVAMLKRQIQESEVLVYAIGIDATRSSGDGGAPPQFPPSQPPPVPLPGQGGWPPRRPAPFPPAPPRAPIPGPHQVEGPVDAQGLRSLTDDSGGRTEIIRSAGDLDPASAGIADELSRQYFLGYQAAQRDGRWHTIDVVVRGGEFKVRARRGYVAQNPPKESR